MLAVYKGCVCGETLDLRVESSAFGSATGVSKQLELAATELDRWNENHKNCKERVSVQLPQPENPRPNDQANARGPVAAGGEVQETGNKPRGASVGEAAHSREEGVDQPREGCPSTYIHGPDHPKVRCRFPRWHLGPHQDENRDYTW